MKIKSLKFACNSVFVSQFVTERVKMKFDFEKYFESSTIHGFKYLSKKFHWIERFVRLKPIS